MQAFHYSIDARYSQMRAFHYNYGGHHMKAQMAQRRTADEQYQLIMECRTSGLSDYQWCQEHDINPGTFYNWVRRLRAKACYDIPPAAGCGDYKPVPKQDVVKLEVIPDQPRAVLPATVNTAYSLEETGPAISIMVGTASINISNHVDPKLLSQVLETVAGRC